MAYLPTEIRDRPVLSVNWSLIRINKHLGAILKTWPSVGVAIENGRPILYPARRGFGITFEDSAYSGWLSQSVKPTFRAGNVPRESRWVMCWSPDGKRLIGYPPGDAPAETPTFETISTKELTELRRLAEIGRQAEAAG